MPNSCGSGFGTWRWLLFDGLVYAGRNFLAEDGGPGEESSDAEEDDRDEEEDEDRDEPEEVAEAVEVPTPQLLDEDDSEVDGEERPPPWDLCFAWCPLYGLVW